MGCIYNYSIIKELDLIIVCLKNEITYSDLIKLKLEITKDKDFNQKFRFFTDLRLSKLNLTFKEIETFGNSFGMSKKLKELNTWGFITDTPNQVIKSIYFNSIANNFNNQTYSTIKRTLQFLNIDISNTEIIEKEIKEMNIEQLENTSMIS